MKALVAVAALLLLQVNQEVKPDLSSPEATLKSFLAAFSKGDFVLAAKHLHEVEPSPRLALLAMETKTGLPTFEVLSASSAPAGDSRVTLTARIVASMAGSARKEEQESKIALVKVGEEWKIVVPPNAGIASADFLTSIAGFIGNPDAIFASAKAAAKRAACLSNLKQIALAAHMFMADHDDKLKLTGANLKTKLTPYLKNNMLWTCPLHESGANSYSINGNIAGRSILTVDRPAETVMFYEGKNGALDFRHAGSAIVAFVDGHVRAIKKEDAKKLIWTAKAP